MDPDRIMAALELGPVLRQVMAQDQAQRHHPEGMAFQVIVVATEVVTENKIHQHLAKYVA